MPSNISSSLGRDVRWRGRIRCRRRRACQALIKTLGQHTLVGQQRLVHIDGENLNVADVGVRFVSLHKNAPFVSRLFQTL